MNITKTLWSAAEQSGEDGGLWRLRSPTDGTVLTVIASFGGGWDHVSVSHVRRIPNWIEMSFVKRTFFDASEVVMQLHPAEAEYVNNHPRCLHLWRPQLEAIPTPPFWMVGVPGLGEKVDKRVAAAFLAAASAAGLGVTL